MSAWADAITAYKRAVVQHHLGGGVTVSAAARRLGIQRSYLARLKRDLGVEGPRRRVDGRWSPS